MSHHRNAFHLAFERWLPLAVVIVIFSGLVYVAVQQNYRMSANDPQIQIAQDVSKAISSGEVPASGVVTPNPTTEISDSLSTFVIIFTATGTPVGSSVALDGKLPTIPQGVLDHAKEKGENRLTWQPKPGVRVAAVVSHFTGPEEGYVLAGRLLTEIEKRIQQLTILVAAGGLLALIVTYLVLYYFAVKELAEHHHHDPEHHHHHEGSAV